MLDNQVVKGVTGPSNGGPCKKDFRKLYKRIAKSEWFRKAYHGKSLGDFIPIDNGSNNKNL